VACTIQDDGCLNRIRVTSHESKAVTCLDKSNSSDSAAKLNVNDHIQLGTFRFELARMTDAEKREQDVKRTSVLNCADDENEQPLTNGGGGGAGQQQRKVASKITSLFEIQNTLDDTVLMGAGGGDSTAAGAAATNGGGGGDAKEHATTNGNGDVSLNGSEHHKLYIEDTEEEEDEDADESEASFNDKKSINKSKNSTAGEFHLDLSDSINVSSKNLVFACSCSAKPKSLKYCNLNVLK
jgi:hypothetical protein